MKEYVEEFERLYNKVKAHKIEYSEEILGFRLLKAADLPPRDEQLIKATITDFKLNEIKTKLSKIFSEGPSQCKQPSEEIKLKTEPTFHAECQDDNESDYTDEYTDYDGEYPDPENDQFDTYYANYKSFRNKKFSENTSQRRNYVPRYQNNNRRQDTQKEDHAIILARRTRQTEQADLRDVLSAKASITGQQSVLKRNQITVPYM